LRLIASTNYHNGSEKRGKIGLPQRVHCSLHTINVRDNAKLTIHVQAVLESKFIPKYNVLANLAHFVKIRSEYDVKSMSY